MSLIDDLKKWYEDNSYPPEGEELDEVLVDGEWVTVEGQETEKISYEIVDSAARWGNSIEVIYKRGEEYAAVSDIEPATEMQSWGDYGKPEIYSVKPVEVTVTKYVKAD